MSQTIRAIIVDDEKLAREALKTELAHFSDIEVIAECQNGYEAVKRVQELAPDLLFLDIQMPKLDGFDVLDLLGERMPVTIFVTAYDEYALKAFAARAIDYLLKPASAERLGQCLERVRKIVQSSAPTQAHAELLNSHKAEHAPISRILIRVGMDVHVIPVQDIIYIEAQDDYVKIHAQDGRAFLKSERMNQLEAQLDASQFCRIHRSYIVNIAFLKKIEPYSRDSRIAKLNTGATLPISREGYSRLKDLL